MEFLCIKFNSNLCGLVVSVVSIGQTKNRCQNGICHYYNRFSLQMGCCYCQLASCKHHFCRLSFYYFFQLKFSTQKKNCLYNKLLFSLKGAKNSNEKLTWYYLNNLVSMLTDHKNHQSTIRYWSVPIFPFSWSDNHVHVCCWRHFFPICVDVDVYVSVLLNRHHYYYLSVQNRIAALDDSLQFACALLLWNQCTVP